MSKFILEREEDLGNIKASLYTYRRNCTELESCIRDKIQQAKSGFDDLLDKYGGEGLDKQKLRAQYTRLSTPENHKIPAFDIKRSTVTEFMAEFLLEKEFQCIFFERASKKINKSIVDTNRHTTGIDVVGIQEQEAKLKFLVVEVKASEDGRIPCQAADSLKKDIEKALDFENKRLYREIFSMLVSLGESQIYQKYVEFLFDLINKKEAQEQFIESLIVFPFLIRRNAEILEQKNLDDYRNFSELDTKDTEVTGIIWAINRDIDSFVSSIYNND